MQKYVLTIVRSIHLIAKRKPIESIKPLCGIGRRMKLWGIKQIRKITSNKTLISTIWITSFNLNLMHHVVEHHHRRLQHEKARVEDAGVDEDGTKLATLEEFVRVLEEEVVGIQHHYALVLHKLPRVQLVQCELKSPVEIVLCIVRISNVLHSHYLRPVFFFSEEFIIKQRFIPHTLDSIIMQQDHAI